MLPKRPDYPASHLSIQSASTAMHVLSTTKITLSCKPPVRLKLQLDLRQDTSLDLIVIIALQHKSIFRQHRRSLPRAGPHRLRSSQDLELLTLFSLVLSLAKQTPSKLSQNVHVMTCQIGGFLAPPAGAWRAQLGGEAGPVMLILRCDDIQNVAIDGDGECLEVCEV